MRLWSLHPSLLDAKGLVALWREGLLAKKVLEGSTKGYTRHPQLKRFTGPNQLILINNYLHEVADEAERRNYRFDKKKLSGRASCEPLPVTEGQLKFEMLHLLNKLAVRDPAWHQRVDKNKILCHPLFISIPGDIEPWEIIKNLEK